jgi:hypothetical protein
VLCIKLTLLIAIADKDRAILLADRRISTNGAVVDDEFNKLCILFCDNARVAIAFTGLASTPEFNTSEWIADTFADLGTQTGNYHDLIYQFSQRASEKFSEFSGLDNRITFLISGFIYDENSSEAIAHKISNFEHTEYVTKEFTVHSAEAVNESIVIFCGNTKNISTNLADTIKSLLQKNLSSSDLLRFAYNQLRSCSKLSGSQSVIGTQCNSAIIKSIVDTAITSTYHSSFKSHRAYGPNIVITNGMTSHGFEMFSPTIVAGPDIRKKDFCWCGSKSYFKDCHMKKFGSYYAKCGIFKKPLHAFMRTTYDTPRLSGRDFLVMSGYQ